MAQTISYHNKLWETFSSFVSIETLLHRYVNSLYRFVYINVSHGSAFAITRSGLSTLGGIIFIHPLRVTVIASLSQSNYLPRYCHFRFYRFCRILLRHYRRFTASCALSARRSTQCKDLEYRTIFEDKFNIVCTHVLS